MVSKRFILTTIFTVVLLSFSGCSGGGSSDATDSSSLEGLAQKGPFLNGSVVNLCKLDENMGCTSDALEVTVTDDQGSYKFESLSWSGLSKLTISGYYFDEVTGKTSLSPATISAIIEIKSNIKNKKNANLLTHLQWQQMKSLVGSNKTLQEAFEESKDDVKKLFNVHSDDFSELNLIDFSLGKASVNVELLRISAAISKSTNPVGDLEELIKIYNSGGLAAVLESSLYKKLMQEVEEADVKETLTLLGVESNIVDEIDLDAIKTIPFARVAMHTDGATQYTDKVIIKLFGTTFINVNPSITISSAGEEISIINKTLSDDSKSVILDLNETSACKDRKISFNIDSADLDSVNMSELVTNQIAFNDPMTLCSDGIDEGAIQIPQNEMPIAIIGMNYTDEDQEEQNIRVFVGQEVKGLEASYSHDRDDYPFGGITHCQWEYDSVVVKESNDASCDLNGIVFNEIGIYDYTLTVTDTFGATDSNVVHIKVVNNTIPTITLVPRGIEVSPDNEITILKGTTVIYDINASDIEDGENLEYYIGFRQPDTAYLGTFVTDTEGSRTYNTVGNHGVTVDLTDSDGNKVTKTITVIVPPEPTTTLDDINITLDVKGTYAFDTGIAHTVEVSIYEAPEHGIAEAYLVGGEFWSLKFIGTDCFVGSDSFIYQSGDDYGRVNVTVTSPSNLNANDVTTSIYNTEIISAEYLRANSASVDIEITKPTTEGSSSLTIIGGEDVNYDYDPDDSFVGNDYFEYTLSETINECSYSDIGRVDIEVKEYVQELKLLGMCQDPYNIGNELYKTDGTLDGTTLVRNINYQERSGVGFFLSDEYKVGDLLFFGAYDGDRELWQSDGVNTYENNINTSYEATLRGSSYPHCFKMANDKLYFIASDTNSSNYGMFTADGNTITRLSDINPLNDPNDDCGRMNYNEDTSSMYYFVRDNNFSTLNKANMDFSTVEEIVAHEGYQHKNLEVIDSDIFYQIGLNDGWSSSLELWRKKSGESSVELFSGQYEFQDTLIEAENKVFASGRNKAYQDDPFDAQNRKMRLFEITKTSETELFNMENGSIRGLTYLKGEVYFIWWHFDESSYDEYHELYKYNISSQELTQLKVITRMIEDNPNHTRPMMRDIYKFEDKVFVRSIYVDDGDDPIHRDQLWVSDGTVDGTKVINEIEIGQYSSSTEFKHFSLNDEHYMQDEFLNVYKTDYTLEGTQLTVPSSCDVSPDSWSAVSQVDYELSTYYEQNATITGISYEATKVSIENGEYSIGDKNHWTSEESTISNNEILYFRHLSSAQYETVVSTKVHVGSGYRSFSTTTKAE